MKDFISYEEALELKQLGFDEPCFRFQNNISHIIEEKGWLNWNEVEQFVSLPTFSQAFRFFRENYGLFISFVRYRNSVVIEMPDTFSKVYEIWIQDENKDESIWVGSFDGQEEAELDCLRKLIEIVKQRQ